MDVEQALSEFKGAKTALMNSTSRISLALGVLGKKYDQLVDALEADRSIPVSVPVAPVVETPVVARETIPAPPVEPPAPPAAEVAPAPVEPEPEPAAVEPPAAA